MDHIVYCDSKAKVLTKVLSGSKTMIVRGAAGRKLPHGRVFAGETLYFIENDGSGLIKAKAVVTSVFNSEKLTEEESNAVLAANSDKLALSEAQLKRWSGKRYLCLVEFENAEGIEPLALSRQNNMDDWITAENVTAVLIGIRG